MMLPLMIPLWSVAVASLFFTVSIGTVVRNGLLYKESTVAKEIDSVISMCSNAEELPRNRNMLVPLGRWVAEIDQSSSSEDMSSISRQSETAFEKRESPKPEPNSDRIEVTSCNTSTTVLTVPANSEGATFSNSDPTVLVLQSYVHRLGESTRKKKMSVMVGVSVDTI